MPMLKDFEELLKRFGGTNDQEKREAIVHVVKTNRKIFGLDTQNNNISSQEDVAI